MIDKLNLLNLKQPHIGVKPNGWIGVPQIDDAPHVGPEPEGGTRVGLILADQYRVWDRKQTDKSAVLEEFQDFILIRDALVDAHLFHLRHEDLKIRIIIRRESNIYINEETHLKHTHDCL